jgi:hypothetical protein
MKLKGIANQILKQLVHLEFVRQEDGQCSLYLNISPLRVILSVEDRTLDEKLSY